MNKYACTSASKRFFRGAIVHIPDHCEEGWSSELLQQKGSNPGVWKALSNAGVVHGVDVDTGHVVCGQDDDAVWVMEKYEPLTIFTSAWSELPDEIKNLIDKNRHEWVRIMNPRTLEVSMRWAKKKTEEGLIVRIRNTVTGDIIMGAVLGEFDTARIPIEGKGGTGW